MIVFDKYDCPICKNKMQIDMIGVFCFPCRLFYDYDTERLYYYEQEISKNIFQMMKTIAYGHIEFCLNIFIKYRAFL